MVSSVIACENSKHKMMLLTCYGCGIRVSELVALKVQYIDGERLLLCVEQGKGGKDRAVEMLHDTFRVSVKNDLKKKPYGLLISLRNSYGQRVENSLNCMEVVS